MVRCGATLHRVAPPSNAGFSTNTFSGPLKRCMLEMVELDDDGALRFALRFLVDGAAWCTCEDPGRIRPTESRRLYAVEVVGPGVEQPVCLGMTLADALDAADFAFALADYRRVMRSGAPEASSPTEADLSDSDFGEFVESM